MSTEVNELITCPLGRENSRAGQYPAADIEARRFESLRTGSLACIFTPLSPKNDRLSARGRKHANRLLHIVSLGKSGLVLPILILATGFADARDQTRISGASATTLAS